MTATIIMSIAASTTDTTATTTDSNQCYDNSDDNGTVTMIMISQQVDKRANCNQCILNKYIYLPEKKKKSVIHFAKVFFLLIKVFFPMSLLLYILKLKSH